MEELDPCVERSFRGLKSIVRSVAFNPDMKQVVSASDDNVLTLWSFKADLRAYRLIAHTVSLGLRLIV